MVPKGLSAFSLTLALLIGYGVVLGVLEGLRLDTELRWWLMPFFIVFFLLAIYTLLVTALADPGFLPRLKTLRALADDAPMLFLEQREKVTAINRIYMEAFSQDADLSIPEEYVLHVHAQPPATGKRIYVCETCEMFRPSKDTSHCRTCDKCVIGMDHHCGFLGTCIGVRNKNHFLAFLVSFVLLSLVGLLVCVVNIGTHLVQYDKIMTLAEWMMVSLWTACGIFLIFFAPCIFNRIGRAHV